MIRTTGNLIFLALQINLILGGVPHSHNQQKGAGERSADGAFSPRDHDHVVDGHHDTAFDHEAILGEAKRFLKADLRDFGLQCQCDRC